jgi:LEA14-like dessication related protein
MPNCPACGKDVSANTSFCPYCGTSLTTNANSFAAMPKRRRRRLYASVAAVVLVILVIGGSYAYSNMIVGNAVDSSVGRMCYGKALFQVIKLVPPNATLTIPLIISNPTTTALTVNRVQIEFFLNNVTLGGLERTDEPIPPGGQTSFIIVLSFTANSLVEYLQSRNNTVLISSGFISLSGTYALYTFTHAYSINSRSTLGSGLGAGIKSCA